MTILHILFLHQTGSNNPLGVNSNRSKIPIHRYFTYKDIVGFIILLLILATIALFIPLLAAEPDNFLPANPLSTPLHIKPE
jgi:ubiquinol-cytochrome c reductase cytochrome b subunit